MDKFKIIALTLAIMIFAFVAYAFFLGMAFAIHVTAFVIGMSISIVAIVFVLAKFLSSTKSE